MSYRPFFLSSFVQDDGAEEGNSRNGQGRQLAQHYSQPTDAPGGDGIDDEEYDEDSNGDHDGYGPVEVFYDQHVEMPAWESNERNNAQEAATTAAAAAAAPASSEKCTSAHSTSITSIPDGEPQQQARKAGSEKKLGDAGNGSNAASRDQDHQTGVALRGSDPLLSDKRSSTSRVAVRQYAGFVNTAVATMDHAVSVPSALRGAARRTMFDVLIDVELRSKEKARKRGEQQAGATCGSPSLDASSGASAASGTAAYKLSARAGISTIRARAAIPSARDITYRMLFPAAASAPASERNHPSVISTVPSHLQTVSTKPRGQAYEDHDSHASLTTHSTTSLLPDGNSGSHATLAKTADCSQKARLHESRCRIDAAPTPSDSEPLASDRLGKEGEAQASNPSSAAATAPQRGPDRRLRHLLPAHLHGSLFTQRVDGGSADKAGSREARAGAKGQSYSSAEGEDSISDSSSLSGGERPTRYTARPATECSTAEKDGCLRDFLDGCGKGEGGLLHPPPSAPAPMKAKATSKGEMCWLQRLEEEELCALQLQQQRQGLIFSEQPAAVDADLLEAVLMGQPSRRHSSLQRRQQHRGHGQRQRHQRAHTKKDVRMGEGSRSTADEDSTATASTHPTLRSGSKSSEGGSRSNSTQSMSSESVDLMRDIDDDVPQWVRQHEARQQLLRHPQHGLDPMFTHAATAGRSSTSRERERMEAMKPLIGKPKVFYPSCAASRKPQSNQSTGPVAALLPTNSASSRLQRHSTVSTAASSLFTSAAKAASSFMASWKEGKRLFKQNPTAASVVQYLCDCFQLWKPYGPQLQTQTRDRVSPSSVASTDHESGGGDVLMPSVYNASTLPKTCTQQQRENHDEAGKTHKVAHIGEDSNACSGAPSTALNVEQKECGVELKIRVQYVEAAFGVAVVHGTLVWCSENARKRLHNLLSASPDAAQDSASALRRGEHRNTLRCPLQVAPPPPSVSEADEPPWSFLVPEPALMQVNVAVGEHFYIANPYHVYVDQRIVLACYNFTTDAVVRQQEAQYELELEERLHVLSQLNEREDHTARARIEAPDGCMQRHRGMSPVRALSHAAMSQPDRSPTSLGRSSGAVAAAAADRSPHRMVYEIAGCSGTPQRAAQAAIRPLSDAPAVILLSPPLAASTNARTPDRTPSTRHVVYASPEPYPPFQNQNQMRPGGVSADSEHPPEQATGRLCNSHNEAHYPNHSADSTSSVSRLASCVRASATVSPSVNSLAADGFYDPLAMPAFRTTTTGAAAASMRRDGNVTMVLTGNSADAEGEDSRLLRRYKAEAMPSELLEASSQRVGEVRGRKSWWRTSVTVTGAGVDSSESDLKPPPSFQLLLGAPSGMSHHTALARSQNAEATHMTGETVRMFGSGEASVEDSTGNGFPRGPPSDWDVPVEVLFALSGLAGQRASKAGIEPRPWHVGKQATGAANTTDSQRQCDAEVSQEALQCPSAQAHLQHCKRVRENFGLTESQSEALPVVDSVHAASLLSQAVSTQEGRPQEERGGRTSPDVSCSFPTPLPSFTEQPSPAVYSPAKAGNSLSCSISSPSDLSDATSEHDVDRALSQRNARVDRAAHYPPYSRAPPPPAGCLSHTARGSHGQQSLRQQEQQRRQEEWMRRLWQQQPGEAVRAPAVSSSGEATRAAARRPASAAATGTITTSLSPNSFGSFTHAEEQGTAGEVVGSQHTTWTSPLLAAPPSRDHTRFSAAFGAAVQPHDAETDATTATNTGFYAVDDVILSDSDD
ncbi:hypothetical protein ABL78_1729 [Leptomonas seymouri]|uniref:Uncharacterized protein n=1 Tax=Leptomonas seymouri TaxID=5684 RepID=A0A0N0P7U2_LEPSE|nr:hypothetical protein ABL78_1729 [Leptomonas seymouri]|eukprot:KPI89166.1 hypothetical protein ABL78_1729 [Leptomonas seymouri]